MPLCPPLFRSPRAFRLAPALLAALALLLPSCAYMQTHKNVKEMGRSYKGYELSKPRQLYRLDGTWYVQARPATYRLHHDFVHDNVFRKSNKPSMRFCDFTPPHLALHEISPDTATVLLRADGYVDNTSLAREIAQSPAPWRAVEPRATTHAVKAQLAGEDQAAITYAPTPAEVPLGYRILSGIDFVLVDIPGTVAYNVAVPFVSPFVFFREFLSD